MIGLTQIIDARSRAINAENPTGEEGKGGTKASKLGIGRKGSPCISVPSGSTVTLANIQGAGIIEHIWVTVTDKTSDAECFVLRDLILRIYWDDEETPSVEAPLGDFFCLGFGSSYRVNSQLVIVNPNRGMNCYFPMPYRIGAKITIESQHPNDIDGFFYQIDYCECSEKMIDLNLGYFHAQWRREAVTKLKNDYVVVDDIEGEGHYIGTFMALSTLQRYWWGEGEFKFYIDDDVEYPTICGTGMEDYFGGAWSFAKYENIKTIETTFNSMYMGYPYYSKNDNLAKSSYYNDDCPPMRSFYRWHVLDPIRFKKKLKVTVQQIGLSNNGLFERQDDVSTVAYWYQKEPHKKFKTVATREERIPR